MAEVVGKQMQQTAPFPEILENLVRNFKYRPGWDAYLLDYDRGQGSSGLTLIIVTQGYDTYHPDRGETYHIRHFMPVPPAAYNERSWQRWLFDQILLIERHEACEFFQIGDERPYAPNHGEGHDPYIVFDHATDEERRTSYLGEVRKDWASE